MRHRLHKLLLILIALSVALAPLRVSWALPDTATPDTGSHCAGMQHDMQQMDHDTGRGNHTDHHTHKCKSGCNGSCCDQGCGVCLHAPAGIPVSITMLRATTVHEKDMAVADSFSDQHLKPPLHPPITLHR